MIAVKALFKETFRQFKMIGRTQSKPGMGQTIYTCHKLGTDEKHENWIKNHETQDADQRLGTAPAANTEAQYFTTKD